MADFQAGDAWVELKPSAKGFSKEAKKALAAAGDLDKQVDLEANKDQLERAIKEVKAHLKALDREKATPSIEFESAVAEAKIKEVQAKLDELGRKEASPKVDVEVAKARQELNTLEKQLEQINQRRASVNVDADITQAQTALRTLEAELDEVNRRRAEPKVTADTTQARHRLEELDGRLSELAGKQVSPKVELQIAQAQQEALRIRAELDRLGAMRPSVQVDADIASASAKLAAVNAQLNQLDGKTANVNINSHSASQTTLILMGVVAALGAIGAAAPAAAAALAAVGGAVGGIGQGAAAAMAGFSGIGDALKALEQDEKSAASTSSAASSTRAAGAKQVAAAQRQLQQAQVTADRASITGAQQVSDARRALADAQISAAQRVRSAEASLASAQRSRQYAQENLTRATQDAIKANRDLQLSVAGAALSEERASLSLAQARKRLAESTSTDPLERADLALSVREAEQQLKETQTRYGDLRQEQSQWARSGVQGSQQVVTAQRAVEEANRGVTDAQKALSEAQVSGAREIADAQRAVARAVQQAGWQQQDAARQVADAQRAVAEAHQQSGETASASSRKAAQALAELTPAGRSMVGFLRNEWQPTWKRTSDAVADVMLPKVERGLRNLLALEPVVRAGLVDAGSVIGDLTVKGTQLASSPAFRQDFATIMASNNRQLENYGNASISLFGAFTDLYAVAGPVSERFSRLVDSSMQAFESFIIGKRATGELEDYLQSATDVLMYVGGWLVDVAVDVYQFATALAPLGVALLETVRWLTDFISSLAQINPTLTSLAGGLVLTTVLLSKFGKAIAVGGAITNTVAGVRTASGALSTMLNPAALAASGALTSMRGGFDKAGAAAGSSAMTITRSATAGAAVEGAFSKAGRGLSMFASALPGVAISAALLWAALDAGSTSLSEAAQGLEKGGSAARDTKKAIEEQNQTPIVGENWLNDLDNWMKRQMGLTTTVEEGHAALEEQRSKMTNLEAAQSRLTEAQGNYELALRDFGSASPEAVTALQDLENRSRDVEIAQIALREKTDLATAAMIWQRDEQLASLDANLRKRQADSQLADAQQRLADAIRDYGAGSKEASDAQLDLEMAQSRVAASTKELTGDQEAYGRSIGEMVANAKGPLNETLTGLVRTLDATGLSAAGAKVHINDAGVAVATFPDGKTVTLDAQTSPTFFANLQAAKAAVDSTKGTIGVDVDTGLGEQKVGGFKLKVDQTTGVVTVDGNITPADQERLGIKAKTDGTTGTMWIDGNPVPADGALNGMRVTVDKTTGVMTIDGDPAKANTAVDGAQDHASEPRTMPVDADTGGAWRAVTDWWNGVLDWIGLRPLPVHTGPLPEPGRFNPGAARQATGGPAGQPFAHGGAISHKKVIGFPTGGRVRGPGTTTSDSIPAMLSDGEYVIRAASVRRLGLPLLDQLNRFAAGGPVGLAKGGRPETAAAGPVPAVAVPSGDPAAAAASASATGMLAGAMEAAASAAGVLTPALASVRAGQQSLVTAGVTPLAGAIQGPLQTALGLYEQHLGTQVPLANASMQTAQGLTQASTTATALNTQTNAAAMTTAVTNSSVAQQYEHGMVRASQGQSQIANNTLAANTQTAELTRTTATANSSVAQQAELRNVRVSQGQSTVANSALATDTMINTLRMSADVAAMSTSAQDHLTQLRQSQGKTVIATTTMADIWRDQLARTKPDSADPIRWVINYPMKSIVEGWNNLNGQFALDKHVTPYVPNFATGGNVSGPGGPTDDKIPAMLSDGEFVVRESVASRVPHFLKALNGGQTEAMQAAGAGHTADRAMRLADGGPVSPALARGMQFAREQHGKPYIWAQHGPRGYDCCITGPVRVYGDFGAKPIRDVRPGDRVFSYEDGKLTLNAVTAAWQSKTQPVFKVRTRNRAVTASANHPFMRLVKQPGQVERREEADWPGPLPRPAQRQCPCGRKPLARGLCGSCYASWKATGEPAAAPLLPRQTLCSLSTCEIKAKTYGLCDKHFQRYRAHGDPRIRWIAADHYDIEWARLDELQRGDLLVQPRAMLHEPELSPTLADGTEIDEDVAWLIGLTVGDGTVMDKSVRICVYGDTRDRVEAIARARWTGNPTRNEKAGIILNNTRFAHTLAEFGMLLRGANKRVPEGVWTWPATLQRAFLNGYCDADGHYPTDPSRHGDRTYHSASRELIEDVRALHIMLGDAVANITTTKRTRPIVIRGTAVKNALPLHTFAVWPGRRTGEAALRSNFSGIGEWLDHSDFTVSRVLAITEEGVQDTYDLEVEGAHNFVADGVVVHNSGFASAITNVLRGEQPYKRLGNSASFPWPGFSPGLHGAWSVGAFNGNPGHVAGTLGGVNAEAGGSPFMTKFGPGAVGADWGRFNKHAFLPQIGGEFVSGGAGGGGIDIGPIVDEAFAKAYREIDDVPKFWGSSPQVLRDQGVARFSADKVKDHASAKLSEMFMSFGGAGVPDAALANLIIGIGKAMGFSRKGAEIALVTAFQESGLRNINFGDRDSLGIFQQRPSMGWGTPAQIMNPRYSTTKFYESLRGVPGWEGMPHTVAAQRVQRSAFPNAYAKWVPQAISLVNASGLYDNGGVLPHGGVAVNQSGMPERVLDNVETRSYDTLTRLVGKHGVQLNLTDPAERSRTVNVLPNAVIREKVDITSAMQQAEFEVSRGSL